MLSYLIPVRLENKFQSSRVGREGGGLIHKFETPKNQINLL